MNFKLTLNSQKPGTGLRAITPDACRPGYTIGMQPQPQPRLCVAAPAEQGVVEEIRKTGPFKLNLR